MLATKIWRLCRSLVNARGASYCLVFRDTEGVIQQLQQLLLSTTCCAQNNTLRATREV